MSIENRRYPAKIILFGEQTVLHGSDALAIPFSQFFGFWSFGTTKNDEMHLLKQLLSKTNFTWFDYQQFNEDVHKNLFFKSTIPYSSGLGSSGAISAALYKRFALHNKNLSIAVLKERLAALESMFHGKSSGVDPIISYTNQGVKIKKDGLFSIPDFQSMFRHVYILNSGVPRSALHYIQLFTNKMKDDDFKDTCFNDCILPVNDIINTATSIKSDKQNLLNNIKKISQFQFEHLPEFITSNIKPIWKSGLESNEFYMKLCGAGGGGFYLLFSKSTIRSKGFQNIEFFTVFE